MLAQQNHNFASPLRYPGGKGVLANFMKTIIAENSLLDGDYVEVYAGGAGIAWALLLEEYVKRVHINDVDSSLMAFWRSVLESTDELCQKISDTPVTLDQWHRQRNIQERCQDYSAVEVGFSTFFLNRTNRSGILRGGVIGGKMQTGKWKIDARFNKSDLIRRVQRIARYSNRIRLYNLDAAEFIKSTLKALPVRVLAYLDPPYYKKGQELYENHYSPSDHAEIAALVATMSQRWVVSYDAAPEIFELYQGQLQLRYNISYSAQGRYSGSEVMFYNRDLRLPIVDNPALLRMPTLRKYGNNFPAAKSANCS
jgi:DNA adenine methylase